MTSTADEALDTQEILRAVRRVQLRTRRVVTDAVAGGFRSVFRGSGMEFEEVREYVPGDDVRSIDWNVTARTGRPHVKKFVEEREQTVYLVVDVSASMRFGSGAASEASRPRSVRAAAAELAAVLAFAAADAGDKVGLLLVSDGVELELPPRGGTRQAFRITRESLYRGTNSPGTSLGAGCEHLARVLKRHAYVFVLSDWLEELGPLEGPLGRLGRRHDVVALRLLDPLHEAPPPAGLVRLHDPEVGHSVLVDTGVAAVREAWRERARARAGRLRAVLRRQGIDLVDVPVAERRAPREPAASLAVVDPLVAYLRRRERRMRR